MFPTPSGLRQRPHATMVMLSGSIVTPDNSHEDDGDWKMQLESGAAISDAEWEQLARDRVRPSSFVSNALSQPQSHSLMITFGSL